jgi:hypothetical protein
MKQRAEAFAHGAPFLVARGVCLAADDETEHAWCEQRKVLHRARSNYTPAGLLLHGRRKAELDAVLRRALDRRFGGSPIKTDSRVQ